MKHIIGFTSRYVILAALLFSIIGCAQHYKIGPDDPYGFFSGLWHGWIFFFSLAGCIISWVLSIIGISFLESVEIIGRPNTGMFFYYVGFGIGILTTLGGGASSQG